MFYDEQPIHTRESYKSMLTAVGRLSQLFSDSESPYLAYRAHENIFARYFDVEHNARHDDSADAISSRLGLGIGLKTWVGGNLQKVAEFGRLRPEYADLESLSGGLFYVCQAATGTSSVIVETLNILKMRRARYRLTHRRISRSLLPSARRFSTYIRVSSS